MEAILGQRSAHSLATGPVMADPGKGRRNLENRKKIDRQKKRKAEKRRRKFRVVLSNFLMIKRLDRHYDVQRKIND